MARATNQPPINTQSPDIEQGTMTSEEIERRMTKSEDTPQLDLQPVQVFQNQPLYVIPTKLPKNLCDIFNEYFENISPVKGETMGGAGDAARRNTDVRWCEPSDWVGPFVHQFMDQANESLFQYDITGTYFSEVHHLTYKPGQFYNWHVDANESCWLAYQPPQHKKYVMKPTTEWTRKLSFTLQLSDPSEYEGGDVELQLNPSGENETITLPKERGTFAVFDSRTKHRVNEVTKGTRRTLVGWAIGPKWR